MKPREILIGGTIAILTVTCSIVWAADANFEAKARSIFDKTTSIEDLREFSTTLFKFLDKNRDGSISIDDIDLRALETDWAKVEPSDLNVRELQVQKRRADWMRRKFMDAPVAEEEFKIVDTDNDGSLSESEYKNRHRSLNLHYLTSGLRARDEDSNGTVELHEFNSHLDDLELLDENADTKISFDEAQKSNNKELIMEVLRPSEINYAFFKSVIDGDLPKGAKVVD